MIDAVLIEKCADPGLKPAIVERFIAEAGSPDPLTVSVRLGNRVVLVPNPTTPEEAIALMNQYVGKAIVRVGITQYPAGFGIKDPSELKPGLVDACENIRMGTALFGKVYRIVTKWYGNAVDDAILAWKTGYFEGKAVFSELDPGEVKVATPAAQAPNDAAGEDRSGDTPDALPTEERPVDTNPNAAGIRIDLSAIGGRAP